MARARVATGLRLLGTAFGIGGLGVLVVACSAEAEIGIGGDGTSTETAAKVGNDGEKNGNETDVDCGGSAPARCADGKACDVGGDCLSGVCGGGKCAAPAPDDGVKNGDETGVDCGGPKAPKCAALEGCAADSDCVNDSCAYDKKCAPAPSCTGHHGGDTCGAGETGKAGAAHESCCETVTIADGPKGAFTVDKYQLTAGRMRAFIEKTQGDVRGWIAQAKPPGWSDAWSAKLPTKMSDALYMLGPGGKRGCDVKNQGGRTYWQPPIDGDPAEKNDFSQEVLDEKALNCVTWEMAAAVCAFDGKRLVTSAEMRHLFKNGGTTTYPWEFQNKASYNPSAQDPRLNHRSNYATPDPPTTMRLVGTGANAYPLDHAFYMSPPGRFPGSANKDGVQDVAGNMLPWVSDGGPRSFVWTFSWETHKGDVTVSKWTMAEAYYAIGVRCASE